MKLGLQGKITLSSDMTEEDIRDEIRSAFTEAMGDDSSFPFTFLQMSGCGGKSLSIPSLSASFQWNAQEVCKLGKSCIYILAGKKLKVKVKTIHDIVTILYRLPKCVNPREVRMCGLASDSLKLYNHIMFEVEGSELALFIQNEIVELDSDDFISVPKKDEILVVLHPRL